MKAVMASRFVPTFRTFVPFVAGISQMNYTRFVLASVIGTMIWVTVFVMGGYFFGSIPWVRENFALAILLVSGISNRYADSDWTFHSVHESAQAAQTGFEQTIGGSWNFFTIIDVFLHLDVHLGQVITEYGTLQSILFLFAIIFCETGLVVTPFLPGDSLLFAAGAFAALGSLDLTVLLSVLYVAPILVTHELLDRAICRTESVRDEFKVGQTRVH